MAIRLALVAALLALPAASQEEPRTAEERRAYEWFRSLGYPDLSEAPFVRFYAGGWEQTSVDPPRAVPDYGFLVDDSDGTFTVFTFGLATWTLEKNGRTDHTRIGYEAISFVDYVRSGLEELENPSTDWHRRSEPFGHLEYSPPLLFRLFTVACACASRKEMVLAHRVWRRLRREMRKGGDESPVFDAMKGEVAAEAGRNLILRFEDPRYSFADQLARCRWWRDHFGENEDVAEWIRILEAMIAEEEPEDPVPALIFRLRESGGLGTEGDAAQQLADLGFEAVPQLIDALGDRRFTRSVRGWETGDGYLRSPVAPGRVGDLARGILWRIAAVQDFEAEDGDALREEVQRWWDGARTKSEREYLVARVEAAERYVVIPGRRLLERYPDAAEEAILRGLEAATDDNARYGLLLCLQKIESERVTAALLKEVKTRYPFGRLLVSWLLLGRGRDEGVSGIVELWRGSGSARDDVVHFLCHCGRLEALEAVREDFADRPVADRFKVVWSLLEEWSPRFVGKEKVLVEEGWDAAVEALLAGALLDTGGMTGMQIGMGEYSFVDPRIGDVAATALARRFPAKYAFDPRGTRPRRDRQRIRAANTWRREHGLELLDVPRPREVQPLDPDTLRRLRAQVLSGDLREAIRAVEAHGLPALRPVTAWLAELGPGHPELEALARRLSCRVVAVEIADDSAPPDDALRTKLAAIEDATLTADAFVGFVVDALRQLPEGATGIELSATREGDGTGVVIGVRLPAGKPSTRGGAALSYTTWLSTGGPPAEGHTSGSCSLDYARSSECWSDFSERLEEVLASEPGTPFEVAVHMGLDR